MGGDTPVHAAVVNGADVIALVHDRRLDREAALARSVDQREHKVRLGRARRRDRPSDGQASDGADGSVDLIAVEPAALARSGRAPLIASREGYRVSARGL
jgi:hypothetical protein